MVNILASRIQNSWKGGVYAETPNTTANKTKPKEKEKTIVAVAPFPETDKDPLKPFDEPATTRGKEDKFL
jgi:hypothetical protein